MEQIKKVWPKWEVLELIGQGGFGKVYKAKRELYGSVEYSAIKVMHIPTSTEKSELLESGLSREHLKEYFEQNVISLIGEIKLMSKFKSAPHIVGVEDYEVIQNEDGLGYTILIRMELLTNISEHFKKTKDVKTEVIKMAKHMLDALSQCHKQNIIHRDIKPANIFISEYGDYKLGDFGVSKEVVRVNSTMSMKGTKSYMAPEMFNLSKYNHTVDLYALGLTMYELLNHNRMPFLPPFPESFFPQDREEALVKRLMGKEFPDIEGIGKLNKIIKKACHIDPNQRYQNAAEMLEDISNMDLSHSSEQINDIKEEIIVDDVNDIEDQGTIGASNYNQFLFDENIPINTEEPFYITCPVCGGRAYKVFTHGYRCGNINCQNIILTEEDEIGEQRKQAFLNVIKNIDSALDLIKIDPNSEHANLYVADYWKRRNLPSRSLPYALKAYELQGEDGAVIYELAMLYYYLQNFEEAYYYFLETLYYAKEQKTSRLVNVMDINLKLAICAQKCGFSDKAYGYLRASYLSGGNRSYLAEQRLQWNIGVEYSENAVKKSIAEDKFFLNNTTNGRCDFASLDKAKSDLKISSSNKLLYVLGPVSKGLFSHGKINYYTFAITSYGFVMKDHNKKIQTIEYPDITSFDFVSEGNHIRVKRFYTSNEEFIVSIGEDCQHLQVLIKVIQNHLMDVFITSGGHSLVCPRCSRQGVRILNQVYKCTNNNCNHVYLSPYSADGESLQSYLNYQKNQQSFPGGLEEAKKLTNLDYESAHAYVYLSQEYFNSKVENYQYLSFKALRHAVTLNSTDGYIYHCMASYYFNNKDYSKAVHYGAEAIERHQQFGSSIDNKADLYINQAIYLHHDGKPREAFTMLKNASDLGFDAKYIQKKINHLEIGKDYYSNIIKGIISKHQNYMSDDCELRFIDKVRSDLLIDDSVEIYFAAKCMTQYTISISSRGIDYVGIYDSPSYRERGTLYYWQLGSKDISPVLSGIVIKSVPENFMIAISRDAKVVYSIINEIVHSMGLKIKYEPRGDTIELTLP